jgi:electron transfer flavoprotein alpha subunit
MAEQVFAYIENKDGVADDTALDLISAAKKISPDASPTAIVTGSGAHLDALCNEIAASYQQIWKYDNEALAYPNAEVIRKLLAAVLPQNAVVLVPHDTFGMDLSPGLSIKLDSVFVPDAVDFEGLDGTHLKLIRQEYSGQVSTHVTCDISSGVVINVRPGAFPPDESKSAAGQVIDKSSEVGDLTVGRRFLEIVAAEVGDVDITKEEPIVDAKWLEKPRQVGTSGQTVKPKVYLALGISGSFQHLGGLKGNPFIVAVNKNPKAPIFQVADVGVVEDLLEFVPVLTEKIQQGK